MILDLDLAHLTVDVGTTDTACVDGNVDIIFFECLELEFLFVK